MPNRPGMLHGQSHRQVRASGDGRQGDGPVEKHFRLEFLNHVDDVIIFQSLDESGLARIVDNQLAELGEG